MKIDGNSNPLDLGSVAAGTAGGARKAASAAAAPRSEAVSLSDLSTQMHELEARLTAEPAFDATKVDQVKEAIRSGAYRVNPEAIADGLIASVREFLQPPRG